jgi:CheY-like chemotaxis protein
MTLADCTVMVVEDHEFQRQTTLQILANLGARTLLEAADGEGALALLAGGQRPDIVVCDLDMPGMDGIEFFRHVSESDVDVAVVIASGLEDAIVHAAATTARAYGVEVLGTVRKPLTARRLLEVVGLHRPLLPGPVANGAQSRAWRDALTAGGATVRLLPRMDLLSGRPAGLQARASRSDSGPPPSPVDAATDLSATAPGPLPGELADLVLAAACAALCELDGVVAGLDATLILPPAASLDLRLADRLAARANAGGIDPRRLCIALPREPALPPSAAQFEVLTRLRMRGFGLGVDGFTAGDPTLGGPMGLPLTEVTLAPDAVAGAADSPRRAEALEATIWALLDRGVRVVAAGCDSDEDRARLALAGCNRAQGAIVGPAGTVEELTTWAAAAAAG